MTNHGTPSLSNVRVSLIYWGNWGGTHPYDAYYSAMMSTPAFYSRLREYGATTGTFNRSFDLPGGATGSLTEAQLQSGILQALGNYVPTAGDVLIALLPNGTTSLFDTERGFGGHHTSYNTGFPYYQTIPWGVNEFFSNPTDMERRSTHEVFEMITDPDAYTSCSGGSCTGSNGNGWWGSNNDEIGDRCNIQTAMIAGLPTQKFWSQAACRCVSEEDLNNADCLTNGRFCRTVFRPSNFGWYAQGFSTVWGFGNQYTANFTGDFDGDGRTEFATFLASVPGSLSILNIKTGIFNTFSTSTTNWDIPEPGDYDGDGKTDIAFWDTQSGNWFVQFSSTPGAPPAIIQWGQAGDEPVPADYDGDGLTDFAVFRQSQQTWWILPANGNPAFGGTWSIVQYTDQAVAGDFNGDGLADVAFWRYTTGTWYVSYQNAGWYSQQWGQVNDIPIGRDVDGDWITDLTVFRPSSGVWYTINSSTWGTSSPQWGIAHDVPMTQ
jgi:hypothetical protein